MTRFARMGRTKALEATPWPELKKGIKYDWKEGDEVKEQDSEGEEEKVEEVEGEGEEGEGEKDGEEKVEGTGAGEGEKKKKKKKKNKKKKKAAENTEDGEGVEGDATQDGKQSKEEKKSKKEADKEKEKERLLKRREQRKNRRNRHKTCLGCRARGHVITECPQVKGTVTGICYKCGSTQHKTAGCRKKVDPNVCFICKEKGHLTRSCPDNPRGLYPKGGSCGMCGSVEHLKQNCPENNRQKEETSIRLSTRDTHESVEDDDDLENQREDEVERTVKTKKGGFKAVNKNREARMGGSHPYAKPKSAEVAPLEDRSESVVFAAPKPKAKPVKVVKF